jgi:hypothetical protein
VVELLLELSISTTAIIIFLFLKNFCDFAH